MTEYGADWPLWSDGMTTPEEPGPSPVLVAGLHDWQDLFDREFHWDTGWRTGDAQDRYARAAADLLHRLTHEVAPDVDVVLDAWPVIDPTLKEWLTCRQRALE